MQGGYQVQSVAFEGIQTPMDKYVGNNAYCCHISKLKMAKDWWPPKTLKVNFSLIEKPIAKNFPSRSLFCV